MRCGKAINKVDDEVKASGQIAVHATWPCDLRIKLQWKLWRERILKRQQKENEMVAVAEEGIMAEVIFMTMESSDDP